MALKAIPFARPPDPYTMTNATLEAIASSGGKHSCTIPMKYDPGHESVARLNCFAFSVLCLLNGGLAESRSLTGDSSVILP